MDAILSIKSSYSTAIYQCEKTIEVRKTPIKPCDKIYLYETAPKSLITGYIQITQPQKVDIETIIRKYLRYTLLTEEELIAYAGSRPYLYLWPIIHAEKIKPIEMISKPPQSFCYV